MSDDKKQFVREPLNRQIQRTVALSLDRAMAAIDLSPEQRKHLIQEMSYQISIHSESTKGFDSFFGTDGKDRESQARKKLISVIGTFFLEVGDVIHSQINDQINVKDVLNDYVIPGTGETIKADTMAKTIALGWVRRILFETLSDDLGPDRVAQEFDNTYYQIAGQKLGPADFRTKAKPYESL